MLKAVEARERHMEAHWLMKAMNTRAEIPSTFDDRMPEEVFATDQVPPLRIGETYLVPDGSGKEVPGLLYDGSVIESERKAYCVYRLAGGELILVTVPLSDAEISTVSAVSETFFGVIKHVGNGIKYPMDADDFLDDNIRGTPEAKPSESMAGWPGLDIMKSLPQRELARRDCARNAARYVGMENRSSKKLAKQPDNIRAAYRLIPEARYLGRYLPKAP